MTKKSEWFKDLNDYKDLNGIKDLKNPLLPGFQGGGDF